MSDYMIFMAACFCMSTVAVFVFAMMTRAAKVIHGAGFTVRTNWRNRVVRKQIRRGEVTDNREYKPVDGYGYPSPTGSSPLACAKTAENAPARTVKSGEAGER